MYSLNRTLLLVSGTLSLLACSNPKVEQAPPPVEAKTAVTAQVADQAREMAAQPAVVPAPLP